MADIVTLPIQDKAGPLLLALTDDQKLVLREAEALEHELQMEEAVEAAPFKGNGLFSRFTRYLGMHSTQETEQLVERLAAGVPLSDIEQADLEGKDFVLKLRGSPHKLKWGESEVDGLEAGTFLHLLKHARG